MDIELLNIPIAGVTLEEVEMLTRRAAAKALGISTPVFRILERDGKIQEITIGNRLRFPLWFLKAFQIMELTKIDRKVKEILDDK